jgi:hypothetical protein
MKKLILLGFISLTAVLFSSFNQSEEPTEDNDKVTNSEMWTYMRENVFTELNDLVHFDEEKMFSRCPSGFSQRINEDETKGDMVYGNITFAEGCARDHFCDYKVNWETKDTYLKKNAEDEFLSLTNFVKEEKKKIAKI